MTCVFIVTSLGSVKKRKGKQKKGYKKKRKGKGGNAKDTYVIIS